MALFSISDLHLSLSAPKPMDVFGARWTDYTEKISKNWRKIVSDSDTVVIPGDISWAMKLEEALEDFRFIESLPGKKIIGKGNHDPWWSTVSKMKKFLSENGIISVDFLYNNAFYAEGHIICGTRGWFTEEGKQSPVFDADFRKVAARENMRLEASLAEGEKLRKIYGNDTPVIVYLHFPPVFENFVCSEMIDTMKKHGVSACMYGHLHGVYGIPHTFEKDGISFTVISSDYLNFIPMLTKINKKHDNI